MKAVISMDSFKGSLSSLEAGSAAARGLLRVFPEAEVILKPLADGGEGTAETLTEGLGGQTVEAEVRDPLGRKIRASYGILGDGETAVMEMASSSGITLLQKEELDPHLASTFGFGELLLDAYKRGCRKFIVGIGGSATTEGGMGMLGALGVGFYDKKENRLDPVFDSLKFVERIDLTGAHTGLLSCDFQVACDVTNPLSGPEGAVCVYGPQKGVRPEEMTKMDAALGRFGETADKQYGSECRTMAGAGAAGGLGYAFLRFFEHAVLKSGAEIVLDLLKTEEALEGADLFITGEGQTDGQTARGKGPMRAAELAKQKGAAVLLLSGSLQGDMEIFNGVFDGCFPIVRGVCSLEEAMEKENAAKNLEEACLQALKMFRAGFLRGKS